MGYRLTTKNNIPLNTRIVFKTCYYNLNILVVTHDAAIVSSMKDTAQPFGHIVWWIQNTRNMLHNDISSFFPILNWKESQIHMTGMFGWRAVIVDNFQSSKIIDIAVGWFSLFLTKLLLCTSKVSSKLCSRNNSNELCFSRTTSSQYMSLWLINDSTTTISKNNLVAYLCLVRSFQRQHQ